jgi:hypothetical protein
VVVVDQAGRPLGQTTVAARTRTTNRLRWHLHQLDPDLVRATRRLPGPGLRRLAAWLAQATRASRSASAAARSPRSARSPTRSANWTVNSAGGSPGWPIPAQPARLRTADRGQAHRRDRRRGPGPGQLRPHRPPPAVTGWQPPVERRPAPHRHHPAGPARPRPAYFRRRRAQGDGTVRPSALSSAAPPAPSTSDSELPNPEPTPSTPPLDRGATYSEERSCRGILRKRRQACARVRGSCGATPFVSAPVMLHPAGSQPTRAGEEDRSRPKTLTSRSFSRPSTALEGPQSTTARRRSQ